MNVVGVARDGQVAFRRQLGHGEDPRLVAFDAGYLVAEPLEAFRDPEGVLHLMLRVEPVDGAPRPPYAGRGVDVGLPLSEAASVEVRQRVAAYALVTSHLGMLATEFSDRTAAPGRWGPPGGGLEEHEQPEEALLREVAEETQQIIDLGRLVEVQTSHWVGRSPRDTIEDFHAVRLVYTASCPHPSTPVVVDVGGTTRSARWVPLDQWHTLAWTTTWREILAELLRRLDGS